MPAIQNTESADSPGSKSPQNHHKTTISHLKTTISHFKTTY
jgi:hypothetical protein